MDSLEVTEAASVAVQKTPNRVTLDSLNAKIAHEQYVHPDTTPHMTICIATLANGFVVVGKAAPADPGNFDADLGRKFAREQVIRQMWELEGYVLRERLAAM